MKKLIKLCIDLIKKYKELILYIIFGVFTTVVNIVAYYVLAHLLKLPMMVSTVIAWILAVFFAYITNRKMVFHSEADNKKSIFKEICYFFLCRIATGVVDWLCMFIFVDVIHLNDIVIKVLANILVIILNFVASKLIIFRHKKK